MKLTATSGEPRELIPPGNYKGILIGICDIGTQDGGEFGPKRQLVLTWELHRKGLDRPYQISRFYTASFNVKAGFRKDVEAMTGRTFKDGEEIELDSLLEHPARIQIAHGKRKDGSPRDEIKSLMPLDEDERPPIPVGNSYFFEITEPLIDIPSAVPKFLRERIEKAPEYTGHAGPVSASVRSPVAAGQTSGGGGDDDDIPF